MKIPVRMMFICSILLITSLAQSGENSGGGDPYEQLAKTIITDSSRVLQRLEIPRDGSLKDYNVGRYSIHAGQADPRKRPECHDRSGASVPYSNNPKTGEICMAEDYLVPQEDLLALTRILIHEVNGLAGLEHSRTYDKTDSIIALMKPQSIFIQLESGKYGNEGISWIHYDDETFNYQCHYNVSVNALDYLIMIDSLDAENSHERVCITDMTYQCSFASPNCYPVVTGSHQMSLILSQGSFQINSDYGPDGTTSTILHIE